MSKPALGRGLGALLGGAAARERPAAAEVPREPVLRVAVGEVRPCGFQPRKDFPAAALRELADSIREQGIVQPLLVRRAREGGGYELIAGERRWRAAQLAGLATVPVIVREADDRVVLELALIENLQRENLNPIEEAEGYARLIDQFSLTQEEASVKVGKSRAVVANALRLLRLDSDLRAHVRDGRLSVGHAKVILGLELAAEQQLAAERVIKQSLNVRQTEDLVARLQRRPAAGGGGTPVPMALDPHLRRLQERLQERFGTRVDLRYRKGRGTLYIHFFNDDDLERVLGIVGVRPD